MARRFCGLLAVVLLILTSGAAHGDVTPGSPRWYYTAIGAIYHSSPAVASDGTIYVGSLDNKLYAVNPDGALKWSYAAGGAIYSSPAVGADGTVYVGSADGKLYAVNPDGTLKWSTPSTGGIGGAIYYSSPAVASDGTIYVGSSDNKLYAINPANGSVKWSYAAGGAIRSSPAIASDGTIYVGSLDKYLYALNSSGSRKWYCTTGGEVWSSPAIASDGTVYVGSWDGKLYAINPGGSACSVKWSYATGGGIWSSPAIGSDGTVYVGSDDKKLYALSSTGSLKWSYTTGGPIDSSPAVGADGTIYVGASDYLYAVSPSGSLRWSYAALSQIWSSPAIATDGTVYVGEYDGNLAAIYSSSQGLANSTWPMFHHNLAHTGRNTVDVVLTLIPSGAGAGVVTGSPPSVNCGANCSAPVSRGLAVTLIASPDAGSSFGGWSGGCTGTGTCQVTMSNSITITATFNPILYTLSASTGAGGGTLSASGLKCTGVACTGNYSGTYPYNTPVTITAVADTGSTFGGWTGCDSTSGNRCMVAMTGNKSISAAFFSSAAVGNSKTLTVAGSGSGRVTSAPSGIDCGSTCSSSFPEGASVTLTAVAKTGFAFAGWWGGCSGTSYTCELVMTSDVTVTAAFDPKKSQHKLAVSKRRTNRGDGTITSGDGRINCGKTCGDSYHSDVHVILSAAAAADSTFTGWGAPCSGTGSCSVRMDTAKTVTATFTGPQKLTVRKQRVNNGGGTVESDPAGISCGADCVSRSALYPLHEKVTLAAAPDPNSVFSGWSPASICSGTGVCQVTIDKAKSITAKFTGPLTLAVRKSSVNKGTGTVTSNPPGISCGPDCADASYKLFLSGETITLTAQADVGSVFSGWSPASLCAGTGVCAVTMNKAKSVTARFTKE